MRAQDCLLREGPYCGSEWMNWPEITTACLSRYQKTKNYTNWIRQIELNLIGYSSCFSSFLAFKVLPNFNCFVSENMKLIQSLKWLLSNELNSFANSSNLDFFIKHEHEKSKSPNISERMVSWTKLCALYYNCKIKFKYFQICW